MTVRNSWKRLSTLFPSNFVQTRMLSDDKYAVAQRKVLLRIIRDRRVQRCVPNRNSLTRKSPTERAAHSDPTSPPERGGCAEYRASLDWQAAEAIRAP
jgi:hypothetical protein